MPNTMSAAEKLLWQLFMAKKPCPEPPFSVPGTAFVRHHCSDCVCKGSCEVFVFGDSVRVPCFPHLIRGCQGCHGLGYTPARDLETWLEVVSRTWHDHHGTPCSIDLTSYRVDEDAKEDIVVCVLVNGHGWEQEADGETHMEALLAALKQALVATGAKLAEVPAEGRR